MFIQSLIAKWVPELERYVFFSEKLITHEGDVAHAFSGGSSGGGSEVVPTGPFGPQIPFIMRLFDEAGALLDQGPPQYPNFSTVAGTNPTLAASQDAITQFVGNQVGQNQSAIDTAANTAANAGNNAVASTVNPIAGDLQQGILSLLSGQNNPLTALGSATAPGAAGAINAATSAVQGGQSTNTVGTPQVNAQAPGVNFTPQGLPQLSGSGIDISNTLQNNLSGSGLNPFIEDTVAAATRGLVNNFQRNVLPSIGDAAGQAGQFGGTRQGIAEGIAAGDLQQNVADVTAQLFANGFDRNVQAQQQALGQIGNIQQNQANLGLAGAGLGLEAERVGQGFGQLGLQAAGIGNQSAAIDEQIRNNIMQQALQGAGLSQQGLQGGLDLGLDSLSTGTAQAGNLLQAGDTSAQQRLFQSLGLIPSLQGNQLAQLGQLNQVGLQQQNQNQAQLTDEVNRFFFNQYAPYNALSQFQNFIGGSFGSSVGGNPNNLSFPGLNPQPQFDPRNFTFSF